MKLTALIQRLAIVHPLSLPPQLTCPLNLPAPSTCNYYVQLLALAVRKGLIFSTFIAGYSVPIIVSSHITDILVPSLMSQVVPYSDHSSFSELIAFVEQLQPSCVRPIVQDFTGDSSVCALRSNMAIFNHLLDSHTPVSDTGTLLQPLLW